MSLSSDYVQGLASNFASADFGDAEDMRPLGADFDIGGHGSSKPYTEAVDSLLQKHMDEIRGKSTAALNLSTTWRRRLKEFMSTRNNELLDYLKLSVQSHPVLGPGEILIRRFGNPQVSPTHASVRDMVLDLSGEDVIAELSTAVENFRGEGGLKDYAAATRLIYDEYRIAGDEVLKQQASLKAKLDRLDRIQGKIAVLFDIQENDETAQLMESTERYLKKVFEENQIEAEYKAVIAAYRRFAALRDIVLMSRSLLAQESEPICSICLNESVAFAVVPCGHTFCQTCVRRQHHQCYMCRGAIKDRVKLYF